MGVSDPNFKRLGIIIVFFLFLTFMYACESVLLINAEQINQEPTIDVLPSDDFYIDEQNQSGVRTQTAQQGGDLYSMLGFITFTSPAVPSWQQIFFAPLVTIILIVQIYLIIDVIYDYIKALPFT